MEVSHLTEENETLRRQHEEVSGIESRRFIISFWKDEVDGIRR